MSTFRDRTSVHNVSVKARLFENAGKSLNSAKMQLKSTSNFVGYQQKSRLEGRSEVYADMTREEMIDNKMGYPEVV